jgi:hypothetical protein
MRNGPPTVDICMDMGHGERWRMPVPTDASVKESTIATVIIIISNNNNNPGERLSVSMMFSHPSQVRDGVNVSTVSK